MVWASLCAVWWFMKLGESFTFVSPPLASSARHTESRTRSLGVSTRSVRHRGRSGAQVLSLSWEALSLDHGGEGQPRSEKSRLFIEPHDGHGTGDDAGLGKASAGGVAFLNGNLDGHSTDGHVTDSGGIDGGDGIGGGGDGQGGGGDGLGDGEEGEELEIAAKGRRRERIVRKVEKAVRRGRIPKEFSTAYGQLLTSPVMAVLCKNSGWRSRLLGDPAFMTKLGIEMVTGTLAQVMAEYQKRGQKFVKELDFVVADTLTCLFANFAAVWLSCPRVAVRASKKGAAKAGGALQHFLASCPSNAFQKVATEGGVSKTFSVYQRGAALVTPMPKLFVIGFAATLFGYGLIAGLETLSARRSARVGGDGKVSSLAEEKPAVPVLGSCLAIGTFLAVSTNLRYQFIAGAVEQRVFDTMLVARPGLSNLGSTAVRSANLYIGSLTIVDWLRFVGLQH